MPVAVQWFGLRSLKIVDGLTSEPSLKAYPPLTSVPATCFES